MSASADEPGWVGTWLADFRDCLSGAHGAAWRARAEQEVTAAGPALASDWQRAASWRRTREELLGDHAA